MAKLVTHKFVSSIPDGDDATIVRPSNWNDTHDVSGVAESGTNTDITSMTGITGGISSPDYIQFDTTYATALTAGQLGWDGNDTLAVGMAGGNVIQHIGEDQFIYIKADAAITKGQVIMFTGAVGASGVLTGAPATGVTNPQYIMGVAAENLAHNAFGLVQTFGELTGLNTNAFNEGDVLYYDSAVTGGLTSTFPTTGPIVTVASVAKKSGGSGVLVIRVTVTQRITAGTGATITQALTGTTVAVSNPYNPAAVAITGGTIDNTTIGATTPSTVNATTLSGETGVLRGTGQNLLRYSQTFTDASWSKNNETVTGNTSTAPNGTTTASTLTTTSISDPYIGGQASTSAPVCYSFYAKQGGASPSATVTLRMITFGSGVGDTSIDFNFSTQTFSGATGSTVNFGYVDAGSGWYRIFASMPAGTSQTTVELRIKPAVDIVGRTVLIWGAQLEVGNTANTYIPTTTTAVYGTPTLSFSGVSTIGLQSNGALYLQPAGTGAIQAQATTSTATGGNARGANAVDWQTARGTAGQVASQPYATIAGGIQNTASGYNSSLVSGYLNTSSGYVSFVGGGQSNTAGTRDNIVVVGGASNTAAGYYNFIGAGFTNSGTSGSAVTTQSATMNGTTAVTLSGSNANIKVGQYITGTSIAGDTYVSAISGTSLTLSKNASGSSTSTLSFFTPHGVVVGGGNNQATGSYSFIGGGGDAGTAANRNVASGDWSFVGGGGQNTASGAGSVICGGGYYVGGFNAKTASGIASFIGGGLTATASGQGSAIVCGNGNAAGGTYAFIGSGVQNTASGYASFIGAGNYGTARSIVGNHVFPACNAPISANQGHSQAALLVLGVQTTDATATVLRSDSNAASGANQVILPNNSAYYFKIEVIAGKTAAGDSKAWELKGAIKRGANAGTTTLIGTVTSTVIGEDAGASAWTAVATADTTNGGIKLTVTGQASTTIRWVARCTTVEMTF